MSKAKELPNVECLVAFRLKGTPILVGDVISKKDFAQKSDWQNLAHMEPARVEETDKKVKKVARKKAPAGKKPAAALPGADAKKDGEGDE
jgi:hypothetical protein